MALQDHSFKKSQYERPNQHWVCGWSQDGWSCPIGPRANGSCRESSECFPIKKGDRWFCTRLESDGGPCQEGPLPDGMCSIPIPKCQPILSLRKRRGRVAFWTAILTFGLLFLILPYPHGSVHISPGQIHSAHGNFGEKCEMCHMSSSDQSTEPVVGATTLAETDGDSHLCLTCHQFGDHAMDVHNQSPESLKALTGELEKIQDVPSPPLALRVLNWFPKELNLSSQPNACGTCHQEHQGKSSNLQTMDNQACQVCHTIQFSSFAEGHPELTPYPYQRRTRIAFDHNSHIDKHFPKEDKKNHYGSCESCHGLSQTSQTMFTKDFNAACAECHTQELQGVGNESSLVFFRLPEIDFVTLGEKRVGSWPEELRDGPSLEQDFTPFMRFLLETNAVSSLPLAQQRLATLQGDFAILQQHGNLYDLIDAEPEVLDASERIIWAIKNFLYDLSTQGQQALISRLQGKKQTMASGQMTPLNDLKALAAQLPIGVVQTAQIQWFPNLEEEITRRKKKNQNPENFEPEGEAATISDEDTSEEDSDFEGPDVEEILERDKKREGGVLTGGWYHNNTEFSIKYRRPGHEDRFTYAWLNLANLVSSTTAENASGTQLFSHLANDYGSGSCLRCHSLDKGEQDSTPKQMINWSSFRPTPHYQSRTHFSHASHFSLVSNEKKCQFCHMREDNQGKDWVKKWFGPSMNPLEYSSNFKPIPKETCSACHQKNSAGENCLLCHNYHIGQSSVELGNSSIDITLKNESQP